MAASPAPALAKLKKQLNAKWPAMLLKLLGIMADARHIKGGTSDHIGGNALDIPAKIAKSAMKALVLLLLLDPRVHYIIWDRVFYHPGKAPAVYRGSNPHTAHAQVSIHPSMRADAREWVIVAPAVSKTPLLTVTARSAEIHKGPGSTTSVVVKITKGGHLRQTGPRRADWIPIKVTHLKVNYYGWVDAGDVVGEN